MGIALPRHQSHSGSLAAILPSEARIVAGPFEGLTVRPLRYKGDSRIVVAATIDERSFMMELDRSWLGPIPEEPQSS